MIPRMDLPDWLDGTQDPGEAELANKVLVPLLLAVVGTTAGIGVVKACCGVKYRRYDPNGLLPIGMAAVTSGIALWSYLNPPPDTAFDRAAESARRAGRKAKRAATPSRRQEL